MESFQFECSALCGSARAALVIAHPGHELRVYGWASRCRPRTFVITDGSGHGGISRLDSTRKILRGLGCEAGEVFGLLTDRAIYDAIREHDTSRFQSLVTVLAASFVAHDIEVVTGDATEWFNPAHDICRMLINAAVDAVYLFSGRTIANYEFCLTEAEHASDQNHDGRCCHHLLDDDRLAQKLSAAHNYLELRYEVEQALSSCGKEYFRLECLKRVPNPAPMAVPVAKPFYEIFGEKRVIEGTYHSVIRFEEHIAPLQRDLYAYVETAASHLTERAAIA